jgi:hypothetical protein
MFPLLRLCELEGEGFFNSTCDKAGLACLETQDCGALDLFAPKLIHEP